QTLTGLAQTALPPPPGLPLLNNQWRNSGYDFCQSRRTVNSSPPKLPESPQRAGSLDRPGGDFQRTQSTICPSTTIEVDGQVLGKQIRNDTRYHALNATSQTCHSNRGRLHIYDAQLITNQSSGQFMFLRRGTNHVVNSHNRAAIHSLKTQRQHAGVKAFREGAESFNPCRDDHISNFQRRGQCSGKAYSH